jgi:hypothetical protein
MAIPYKGLELWEIRDNRWLSKGLINLSKGIKILKKF